MSKGRWSETERDEWYRRYREVVEVPVESTETTRETPPPTEAPPEAYAPPRRRSYGSN